LPASFQTVRADFAAEPFTRLTYAYPARPPARLDLARLPGPMRQEVAYWLHTLAVAGERVNSWALAQCVRIAAPSAPPTALSSFPGLAVAERTAAARRSYHDRHRNHFGMDCRYTERSETRLQRLLALAAGKDSVNRISPLWMFG